MKPILILVLAAALLPLEGEAQEPSGAPPLALPPVFVEASRGDPWRYFTVPGFEVLSHCPDDFNRDYAGALARSAAARESILPRAFWGALATPMKIILYDRKPQAGDLIDRKNPIELGWSEVPGAIGGTGVLKEAYPLLAGDADTYLSCGNYWGLLGGTSSLVVDPDSALLLEKHAPAYPLWFREGLCGRDGLYAHHRFESGPGGEALVIAPASWVSREVPSLGVLLAGGEPLGGAARAQAALFVRWGLLGRGPEDRRAAFLDFLEQACRRAVGEPDFRKAFGFGFAECERRLSGLLPLAAAGAVRLPIAGVAVPSALRDATSVEVARILGDWGRLEGRAQGLLLGDYERACLDQADRLFRHAKERGVGDPQFLAAYGLYEAQVGDGASARTALEAAVQAGVVRPQAYLTLARLRLEDALPWPESGIGDLSGSEFASLLALIRTAQAQDPSLAASYELEARLLEHAPAPASAGELGFLERRLELFPRDARLAYRFATVFRRMGEGREARVIAERSLALADTPEGAALLRSFLAQTP